MTGTRKRSRALGAAATATVLALLPVVTSGGQAASATPASRTTPTSLTAPTAVPASTPVTKTNINWAEAPVVTWVDGQNRQYIATHYADVDTATFILVVGRNLPEGGPDPSWGTFRGQDGLRQLDPTPPAEGFTTEPVVAASDDGLISLTWIPPACTDPRIMSCDRWYTRVTAEGTPVGDPVEVVSDEQPMIGLPDGSFTTESDRHLGWRGPDGADRGPLSWGANIMSATVDHSGRLLVADTAGNILRWAPGGARDLQLDGRVCDEFGNTAIGRSTIDDSFAVICPRGFDTAPTVEHRSEDGNVLWKHSAPLNDPGGRAIIGTTALVDADGRVWAAMTRQMPDDVYSNIGVVVQTFTPNGPEGLAYERDYPLAPMRSRDYPWGVVRDLRPTGDGRVAVADDVNCCAEPAGGEYLEDAVWSAVVAPRLLTTTCTPAAVGVDTFLATADGSASAHVAVSPCSPADLPYHQPVTYRVRPRGLGAGAVATATPWSEVTVGLGQYTFLDALGFSDDETPWDIQYDRTIDLVPPFTTVEGFVTRQQRDLAGTGFALTVFVDAAKIRGATAPSQLVADRLGAGIAKNDIGPVARLYRAAFNRDPDLGGLKHWVDAHRSGTQVATIAERFSHSPEFQRRYGSRSNRAFVTALYQQALGRPGDANGITYWTNRITSRRSDRAQVVVQFSESAESKRHWASVVDPIAATFLLLGRLPSTAERAAWIAGDHSALALAETIITGAEYADRVIGD